VAKSDRRWQGYARENAGTIAAKALKGRNNIAMGEAHGDKTTTNGQALKGRNNQAKDKVRGAGIRPYHHP